jgi:hypothetical protein
MDNVTLSSWVGLSNGKGTPFFRACCLNTQKMAQVLSEEEKQKMRAFLEVMGDRIEVLECLDTYAYFFPDWLLKITEGLQNIITDKQAHNIPCDGEREILTNAGYFFTKIAHFSDLISEWHRELANGKKTTEEALDKL